jgi:hypothetical protein
MATCAAASPSRLPPLEFFYTNSTATTINKTANGCVRSTWVPLCGADPTAMTAPPHATTVDCSASDGGFSLSGVLPAGGGAVQLYLSYASGDEDDDVLPTDTVWTGQLEVNGNVLTLLGSMFWVQDGGGIDLRLSASATLIAVGGALDIEEANGEMAVRRSAWTQPSSYLAPLERAYLAEDAIANNASARAAVVPDTAINNNGSFASGGANALDLSWGSTSRVDPAHIVVLDCEPTNSYVRLHTHPFGAVYMPLAGSICFEHPVGRFKCVYASRAEARWVSPLLRYVEQFRPTNVTSVAALELIERAGMGGNCTDRPVVFTVTNFDMDEASGVSNFVDIPDKTRPMTVRSTYVRSATLHWPDGVGEDNDDADDNERGDH